MGELSTQLATIFLTGFIAQNGYEATKPFLMSTMRKFKDNVGSEEESRMEQVGWGIYA